MKKKRRLNPKLKRPLMIMALMICVLLFISLFSIFNGEKVKSIHSNAKKYSQGSCIVFYPSSNKGKEIAKYLCDKNSDQEIVLDYAEIPYGDYLLIDYGSGIHFYTDKKYKAIKVEKFSEDGKQILSDYLRYTMKRQEIDEAYTLDFLERTSVENLDISTCTYDIYGSNLLVHFPEFEQDVLIPLKYCQEYIGVDMGIKEEKYIKPSYFSSKRKFVAFTFDESPNVATSKDLVSLFSKYDSNATFFVVGQRLSGSTIDIIADSIARGNQYGSNTETYRNLAFVPDEEVYDEIYSPANDICNGYKSNDGYGFDGLGYMMSIYRAPYGTRNKYIDELSPFISIEWDLDTKDKEVNDVEQIKENIYNFESKNPDELDGCIIRMHDGVRESVDVLNDLIPELIEKGYQLVTIDDLLTALKIDKTIKYYPW